eukprot:4207922-Prymnesium_polylepis.1
MQPTAGLSSSDWSASSSSSLAVLLVDAASSAMSLLGLQLLQTVFQSLITSLSLRIMVVTRGTQAPAPLDAAQAVTAAHGGALGVTRVLRLEHPAMRLLHYDSSFWRCGVSNVA